jgi:hypothetical protein
LNFKVGDIVARKHFINFVGKIASISPESERLAIVAFRNYQFNLSGNAIFAENSEPITFESLTLVWRDE